MLNKLKTYFRLGFINLLWVAIYRFTLRTGLIIKVTKSGPSIPGPFFINPAPQLDETLTGLNLKAFGWIDYSKKNIPEWYCSVYSKKCLTNQNKHWSTIHDFNLDVGDIKSVWELSRFDWLLDFTVEFLKTGDDSQLQYLNSWLVDWSKSNPLNQGVNWKCGQETSIRVMHLCVTSFLLKQHTKLTESLVQLLEQHLSRISPTILYAMAQDNNHGTSEAVALYVGGLFLENNTNSKQALKWKHKGRRWLENRVQRLIANDGSFSQYSVNYHRLMLDSLSIAELFRQEFRDDQFSQQTILKIQKAVDWLYVFTDKNNGKAPNLGSNDGAMIIPLSGADYCDYRPTVQLASSLFYKKKYYSEEGSFNQPLKLLSISTDDMLPYHESSKNFTDGGYAYLTNCIARLFLRYPRFHFRPSQCDLLHVDFWLNGRNILRDAGTFSYNTTQFWLDYFPGTAAHNTIQFDDKEQMPRLTRFLYGDWLKKNICSGIYKSGSAVCFKIGYKANNNIEHAREVKLDKFKLHVIDTVNHFKEKATLRWRLAPGNYEVKGSTVIADDFELMINTDLKITRLNIVDGWESKYYMKKTMLPVLEVEVINSGKIETIIQWSKQAG